MFRGLVLHSMGGKRSVGNLSSPPMVPTEKCVSFSHSPRSFLPCSTTPQDSFLLVDALAEEWSSTLKHRPPKVTLEVGCGTGYVIASAAGLAKVSISTHHIPPTDCPYETDTFFFIAEEHGNLNLIDSLRDDSDGRGTRFFATDINPDALVCCASTWGKHGFTGESQFQIKNYDGLDVIHCGDSFSAVQCDLVGPLQLALTGSVDLLLFNPPYVLTPSDEIGKGDIASAWAGGVDGREVIDRLLPKVFDLLAPGGTFMLILLEQNKPKEVAAILTQYGLRCEIVATKSADEERLHVLRARKPL